MEILPFVSQVQHYGTGHQRRSEIYHLGSFKYSLYLLGKYLQLYIIVRRLRMTPANNNTLLKLHYYCLYYYY